MSRFITTFVSSNNKGMKASKRKIVQHLQAGKPWQYQKYAFSTPHSIFVLKKFERTDNNDDYESVSYHINSKHVNNDNKVVDDWFESAPITFKASGHISVFLNCGDINASVNIDFDKIILLDKNFKPISI